MSSRKRFLKTARRLKIHPKLGNNTGILSAIFLLGALLFVFLFILIKTDIILAQELKK